MEPVKGKLRRVSSSLLRITNICKVHSVTVAENIGEKPNDGSTGGGSSEDDAHLKEAVVERLLGAVSGLKLAYVKVQRAHVSKKILYVDGVDQKNELPAAHSCGQVDADGDQWYEIKAAFKLEKQPSKVTAYVQGPPAGVDLRVMDFYIYAVEENRQEFFQFMTLVIVSLVVDKNQWVNCGQVDADGDQWYEIKAAFKLEKQPSKVTAYVQGPPAGVDLRVMDFYIYAVRENRQGWSDMGIGLLCGIEKFDASRGFRMSTYVYWCIHQLPYEDMTPFQAAVAIVQKITQLLIFLSL
ncbi:Eukaryotic translation initiation factor 3 subunit C [Zea mays]|uniref:Eukaryotic translation initiation factor 3 subunit C n=1 Tax=Zea mays TaxID=4577 RepID=A0A1D6DXA7_MAIZE|nr:Eukaryotic translation initiation factor 3 subunit C [Zea mays]